MLYLVGLGGWFLLDEIITQKKHLGNDWWSEKNFCQLKAQQLLQNAKNAVHQNTSLAKGHRSMVECIFCMLKVFSSMS